MVIPALLGCKRAWAATGYGGWSQGTNEAKEGGGATAVNAHRLYAGVDSGANAAQDGDSFYHFFAMPKISSDGRPVVSMQAVKKSSSYITTLPGQSFSGNFVCALYLCKDARICPSILCRRNGISAMSARSCSSSTTSTVTTRPVKEDITDEVLNATTAISWTTAPRMPPQD